MTPESAEQAHVFQKNLPSNAELLEPLVEEADAFLNRHTDDQELIYRAVLLLSEAATNAMKHGNGFDPEKKVRVELSYEAARIRILVCDEGEGFNPDRDRDPLADANLFSTSGRGLFLIQEMADEVSFNDDGRCVTITLGG